MQKLKFLPTTLQAFVTCDRCEEGKPAADCYGTEDGDGYVCKSCITDDERQHLTLRVQETQLAGHVGYLEAADRGYDHKEVREAKDKLRSVRDKLAALWQAKCAPLIESGDAVVYGSPEHRQRVAVDKARRMKG